MNRNKKRPDAGFIENALKCGVPFACWSLPGSQKVNYVYCSPTELICLQNAAQLDEYQGFVFAPYKVDEHKPIFVIPDMAEQSGFFSPLQGQYTSEARKSDFYSILDKAEVEFKQKVLQFIQAFRERNIRKAVLSRTKWLSDYDCTMMNALFEALNQTYSNAFVYQVFIPQAGYWVGATPELLLATENGHVSTVSLAGTKQWEPETDSIQWDNKERVEQELVSEHIRKVIHSFGIDEITEKGPITTQAGNLVHLKTWFEFKKEKIVNRLGEFIQQLHPTPAICGLPVEPALQLIDEVEQYDRAYYTGYLGIFNKEEVQLFVNLRCLQAFSNGVVLYAGGGITPDSKPDKEWEETRLKIHTLQHILDNLEL